MKGLVVGVVAIRMIYWSEVHSDGEVWLHQYHILKAQITNKTIVHSLEGESGIATDLSYVRKTYCSTGDMK